VPQGINFAWNSSALTPDSHPVLDAVAMQLKRHPELSFEVAGHTDNTGNAASNLDISTKRASTVRDYLVMRGIPASLLSVRGYGNEKPIADNSTAQGRAINRRVSLYRPSQEVEVTVRR
jgi:OOP family OmpA-OmpF porin